MSKPFHRYQGSENIPDVKRMPQTTIRANTTPRTIGELLSRFEDFCKDEEKVRSNYPWADRFVMGYPLPKWQRPLVWSQEQKIKLITSLWMEVDIGSYLINDVFEMVKVDDKFTDELKEFSDILLDGQQRLSAMQDYFTDQFSVPDKDGVPVRWSYLSKVERRLFSNQTFSRSTVQSWDEAELRRIYDLRSFGGTAHTEEQRATKKIKKTNTDPKP